MLIDDLGDVITACTAGLGSHEPVELLGAEDHEEAQRVLADLLHMLLIREVEEDLVFEPNNPARLVSARLASHSG